MPENLNDMMIGNGLPIEHAYGWNHAPQMPAAEDASALFQNARRTLLEGADSLPGPLLLANLSFIRDADVSPGSPGPGLAELELAQAFMLRAPMSQAALSAEDVRRLIQALKVEMQLFLGQTARESENAREQLLHRRQVETLYVRHTLYPGEVRTVFEAVTAELGDLGMRQFGISFARISALLFLSVELVQAQLGLWRQNHGNALPQDPGRLLGLYTVSPYMLTLLDETLSEAKIVPVLTAASMSFGDLAGANLDHLHLNNPVWTKPFVRDGDRFFLFSPETIYAFHGEQLAAIAGLIVNKANERLGGARGKALERLLGRSLATLLPSAVRLLSAKWTDPDSKRGYETDAICLVDGVAVIFEAKGDALSAKGRRGSQSWFDDLDDIVVDATEQASRLARLLLRPPEGGLVLKIGDDTRIVPPGEVRHVLRFGVALERTVTQSYGLADALRERLERAGLTPMPALTYGDLNQLNTLVPLEAARVHYLLRRSELERDFEFLADELDLIALYLRTGFAHLHKLADQRTTLNIWGLSDFLRFYQKNTALFDARILIPKRATPFWDQLLESVPRDWPQGWVAITYDLLNVSVESQARFEKDCQRARKRWRRRDLAADPEPAVMQAAGQLRPSLFFGFPVTGDQLAPDSDIVRRSFERRHGGERVVTVTVPAEGRKGCPRVAAYRGMPWEAVTHVLTIEGDGVGPNFLF